MNPWDKLYSDIEARYRHGMFLPIEGTKRYRMMRAAEHLAQLLKKLCSKDKPR